MVRDELDSAGDLRLPDGARIGVVVSRYHAELCDAMLESAWRELSARGLAQEDLLVLRAPGAFELPLLARRLAIRDDVAAVLCLGLVLKGETSHDRHVAEAAARGILRVSLDTDKPVLFGVLTCDTLEQARQRAHTREEGGEHDKGREVARACIEVLAELERSATLGRRPTRVGFTGPGGAPRPERAP